MRATPFAAAVVRSGLAWAGAASPWALALAASPPVPAGDVRPIVVAAGFAARVREASQGEVTPVCAALVDEHLDLCFRLQDGELERWVVGADLGPKGVAEDVAALRAGAVRTTAGALTAASVRTVDGTPHRFVQVADPSGAAAAPFLHPEVLAGLVGPGALRVAAPNIDVTLAWAGDDGERDTILSVGVQEMTARQARPVTAVVFTWDGLMWIPWAEAVPAPGAAGAPTIPAPAVEQAPTAP